MGGGAGASKGYWASVACERKSYCQLSSFARAGKGGKLSLIASLRADGWKAVSIYMRVGSERVWEAGHGGEVQFVGKGVW